MYFFIKKKKKSVKDNFYLQKSHQHQQKPTSRTKKSPNKTQTN